MKTEKGNLVLKEDTKFDESITVEGNIVCENNRVNLTVAGDINAGDIDALDINAGDINARNIDARNINAWNIDAWNIDAWNINAGNINAWNIDARNIDAWNILCEKIDRKTLLKYKGKIKAQMFVENRTSIKQKEWVVEKWHD